MKKKIIYTAILVVSLATLVYSCSTSSDYNSPAGSTTPPPVTTVPVAAANVSIQNFAFAPDTIKVKIGGTVTWTNTDATPHTVTDIGGSFNSGSVSSNQTFVKTFATAGTITYHCTIHPMMKNAVIIVGN